MTARPEPCGFCGAPTYRLKALPGGVIRAFDVRADLDGEWTIDLDAGAAHHDVPANIVQRMHMTRHQLHKDTCPSWAGPVGG